MKGNYKLASIRSIRVTQIALLWCFIGTSPSFAQRGYEYDSDASPWEEPASGFPGYFDTQVANKNSVVVEFPPMIYGLIPTPFMAVDYGLTDTLTIGTNAIFTTAPWLFGARGVSLKIRSLIYGDEDQQSAWTYYAGYLSATGRVSLTANYHTFTWNHAWALAPRHSVTAHLNYHRMSLEVGTMSSLDHASIFLSTLVIGGGYDFMLTRKWSFRADTLVSVYQNIEADTASASIDLSSNLSKAKGSTAELVAQVQFRPVDKWLFGLGGTGVFVGGVTGAAPWFTWARKW